MKSLWHRALGFAEQTPESRNRYVDFLRALSILAVVVGHWVISAPYLDTGRPTLPHILDISPWTHWLTWLFQVMPVFFFVGGYSNYTAWEAATRRGDPYAKWLASRLHRLLYPVLPLIMIWAALAVFGQLFGLPANYIRTASQIAIVPTWFLAVYILVVLFVPLTYRAWKSVGLLSVVPLIIVAALLDWGYFNYDMRSIAWFNYLFVWLTIHQLGYAWRSGLLDNTRQMLLLSLFGLMFLYVAVTFGPYPLALVGVPGDDFSNTLPPKLPLLFLGVAQIGLFMSLEPIIKRWLSRKKNWAAIILINSMIMTIFLWHSTAMMIVIGAVFLIEPAMFSFSPGTATWWIQRIPWLLIYSLATIPFILLFSKFENTPAREVHPSLGVLFLGCALASGGIGYLAGNGFGAASHWGIDALAIAFVVLGATCAGAMPKAFSRKRVS